MFARSCRQVLATLVRMPRKLSTAEIMKSTPPTASRSSTTIASLLSDRIIPIKPIAVKHTPTIADETDNNVSRCV